MSAIREEGGGETTTTTTTPESLKNTAYNIARLEDVIEQCEGRHKYLAHTTSPSDGGDVRWYFCKVPLSPHELAASVPKTEIIGKGDYFRFGMRDSLAIEASFLQREEELLSCWWKEYAECSEGPGGRPTSSKKVGISVDAASVASLYEEEEEEEERVGVPVKGGLFEVDLVRRHCFPVYWNGENRRVLRGHWFARKGGMDWLPIREDVAEQLEIAYRSQVWHRRTFQPSGLFAARIDLQASTPGLHALFTGEDATWEAWLNVDASGFSSMISLGGNGIKLRRGFSEAHSSKPTQDELRQRKEEVMDDYCSQVPVRHVIFMVHGIGQRLEKSNLVDDVRDFRRVTASLAEQQLTSHQLGAQRVLFIPCQWRKGLKLSGEAAVDKITLDGVRGLRVMLSATVHDVLYYMSPIYCQDIINSVSNQLNRLYLKFLKRNPGYEGKVSLYGHSLGSVLSYDILCHQENLSSPFPMDWLYKEQPKVEESSTDKYNQSPKSYLERNSNADDNNVGTIDGQTGVGQSTLEHEDEHEGSVLVSEFPTSNLDTMSSVVGSDETICKGVREIVHNSNDTLSESLVTTDKPVNGFNDVASENCNSAGNTDLEIKLLKDEIDSLKAKIKELESQCRGRDVKENKEALQCTPKKSTSRKQTTALDDTSRSYTPYIKYTKLEFKVDTFFAVGSPLGVFLALRNVRIGIGNGEDYWEEENITEEMPACRQMFNIFHPFDPVAYRVEPLVCKEYVTKRPVLVPYHKGGKRLHIGFQEFAEDLAARSQAVIGHLNNVKVKVLTVCQSKNLDGLEEGPESVPEEERTYGSMTMERLTASVEGRIDYMLQDKTFEHPYLQTLGAHTNYWRDEDTALFILKHLYKDIPEERNIPKSSSGSNLKDGTSFTLWSDQRERAEEELPLTFSNRQTMKTFSSKAKKLIK